MHHPVQIYVNHIAIAVVDLYRVNIAAVSDKLKRNKNVSNTKVENGIIYGGPFLKTYNFQNSRGYYGDAVNTSYCNLCALTPHLDHVNVITCPTDVVFMCRSP